jgi:hypothetical protein
MNNNQGDNNMTTTNGKLKGLCDGCEDLTELQTDEYGLWLCKLCSTPPSPINAQIVERNGRTFITGIGI